MRYGRWYIYYRGHVFMYILLVMKLKSDDLIFLIGAVVIVIMIAIKYENSYVEVVASFFGGHKLGSIVDDKFPDRISPPPPDL